MSATTAPAGPFSLGSDIWPGAGKVVEEGSEVLQVLGKLIASGGQTDHWDGSDLAEELAKEVADLQAALGFLADHNPIDADYVALRRRLAAETVPATVAPPAWPGLGQALQRTAQILAALGGLMESGVIEPTSDGGLLLTVVRVNVALDGLVARSSALDAQAIAERRDRKRETYEQWHREHGGAPAAVEPAPAPTVTS